MFTMQKELSRERKESLLFYVSQKNMLDVLIAQWDSNLTVAKYSILRNLREAKQHIEVVISLLLVD